MSDTVGNTFYVNYTSLTFIIKKYNKRFLGIVFKTVPKKFWRSEAVTQLSLEQ